MSHVSIFGVLYKSVRGLIWTSVIYVVSVARATWMPYKPHAIPIRDIAEATAPKQDELTELWRDMKLMELNTVTIASALIAGVVTGALTWTTSIPWTVSASWLCSLLQSLFAMVTAASQSVALTRASCTPDGLVYIRILMGAVTDQPISSSLESQSRDQTTSTTKISHVRLFVWHAPTMMLGMSVALLLFGLGIMVYHAATLAKVWGPETKTALCFTLSFIIGGGSFFISWNCTEKNLQELCIKAEASKNE